MEKWALITGSSSGIGKAISYELAKKNYSIILHGRNTEILHSIAADIEDCYKVQTKVINVDLSEDNAIETILTLTEYQNIEVLVNNAGFGVAGAYNATDIEAELKMVKVHVTAPMYLIKSFANKMKNNGKGHILNVSSLYSYFSVPKQAIYGASKAFQHSFSKALNEELKAQGIHVSSLCPGLTYSKFRTRQGKKEKKYLIGMTSEEVAKIAVKGLFKKKVSIVPGIFNKFMAFTIPKLPDRLALVIIHKMNKGRGF